MIALRIINIALILLICVVAVKWGLVFFKTETEPVPAKTAPPAHATSQAGLETLADISLFAPTKKSEPISVMKTQVSSINIDDLELKGVFANQDNPNLSLAIIQVDGEGEIPALVGDEVKIGVYLNNVGADYVILSSNGELTRLVFPERSLNKGGHVASTFPSSGSSVKYGRGGPGTTRPPGFGLPQSRGMEAGNPSPSHSLEMQTDAMMKKNEQDEGNNVPAFMQ